MELGNENSFHLAETHKVMLLGVQHISSSPRKADTAGPPWGLLPGKEELPPSSPLWCLWFLLTFLLFFFSSWLLLLFVYLFLVI